MSAGDDSVDVVVVGAGFAGIAAARALRARGTRVLVLEARDRVGGRTWTELHDGVAIDRGGAWLAPGHTLAFSLARELGVTTYKTHVAGRHLLVDGDRLRTYRGLIPKISPAALVAIAAAQRRIDKMAKTVPIDAPWTAPHATEWDARTVADFVTRSRIRSPIGSALFAMATGGLFAAPSMDDVSLLNLAFLVAAHGSIESLFSISGGSQENMVTGGLGALATRAAGTLDPPVVLDAPVVAITQSDTDVEVRTQGHRIRARAVICTTPPALALDITFDPPLSGDRVALYRRAVAGHETKTLAIYDTPFWRTNGRSGQSALPGGPAEVTIDASPADGSAGVLACFDFGPVAEELDELTDDDRRARVLASLARRFGPVAAAPREVVTTSWWREPWSRGCSMAHFGPGVLTAYGHLLRAPHGRVHFAGTETATRAHGAVEGALASGDRAASEVLAQLSGDSSRTPN